MDPIVINQEKISNNLILNSKFTNCLLLYKTI